MISVQDTSSIVGTSDAPVALIYGATMQDIQSLREFLASSGCTVIVNERIPEQYRYVFIVGDWVFVKSIYENNSKIFAQAVIITQEYKEEGIPAFIQENTKVVWLGDDSMNADQIRRVLEFVIVGKTRELILFTKRVPKKTPEPLVSIKEDEKITYEKYSYVKNYEQVPNIGKQQRNISDAIEDIFRDNIREKKVPQVMPLNNVSRFHKIIFIFCVFVLLPLLGYICSVSIALGALAYGAHAAEMGNVHVLATASGVSRYWIKQSYVVLQYIAFPLRLFHLYSPVRDQERFLVLLTDMATVGKEGGEFLSEAQTLARQLLLQQGQHVPTSTPATLIARGQARLPNIHDLLGLIDAHISLLVREHTFPFSLMHNQAMELQAKIKSYRVHIESIQKILNAYALGGGFGKEMTYLILLQNSMELRPAGGFIGSVGLLTMRDGNIASLAIEDVYTIDGQLRGHVQPPNGVKELLAQEHWYLRDSNWSVDFNESGQKAAWFYEKSTGKTVSGVVGVSLPFITQILSATGPILLTDYNDTISADNFFGKSFFYTKNNFFPGSTQKKDFLGSLLSALLLQLSQTNGAKPMVLLSAIEKAFASKSLQLWVSDPKVMQLISSYQWDGSYQTEFICKDGDACMQDGFGLVEANVSLNKVNYFVTRTLDLGITITDNGTVSYQYTVIWKNESKKGDTSGGGEYRSYSRIYFPLGVKITSIRYDGKPVSYRTDPTVMPSVPYAEFEERQENEPMEHVIVVHDVHAGGQGIVEVTLEKQTTLPIGATSVPYIISLQKQSGVEDMPYVIHIDVPQGWQMKGMKNTRGKKYEVSGKLDATQEHVIEFVR